MIGHHAFRGCLTCFETFEDSVLNFAKKKCLGERIVDNENKLSKYIFRNYAEVHELVKYFSSGLVKEGLLPPNPDDIKILGIYLKNCPNWLICEQACYRTSAVTVPLYETFDMKTIDFIINQTKLTTIVCAAKHLQCLLDLRSASAQSLDAVIVSDVLTKSQITPEILNVADKLKLRMYSFEDIVRIGSAYPSAPLPPSADSLASFCYTSGTTGQPKGALISHENFISVMTSGLEGVMHVQSEDVYLSFLPLAHIFERLVTNALLASGSSIGFFTGDLSKLIDDIQHLRPTIFCAVPRLLNRIRDKVLQGFSSTKQSLASSLFNIAVKQKLYNLKRCGETRHMLWDALVFDKIKHALGLNRVRLLLSGFYLYLVMLYHFNSS